MIAIQFPRAMAAVLRLVCCAALSMLVGSCRPHEGPTTTYTDGGGVQIASIERLPSLLDETFRWSTRVDVSLPTQARPDDQPLVFNPTRVIPLSGGNLLVFDGAGDDVLVIIDPVSGAVLHRFGRRGDGPGQISDDYFSVAWETENQLKLVDVGNGRQLTFSMEGELLDERPLGLGGGRIGPQPRPGGGALLEQWTWPGPKLTIVALVPDSSESTHFVDLHEHPPDWQVGTIQLGRPLWASFPTGLVTARSDLPRYRIYDAEGRPVREVRIPLSRRTLSDVEIARERQESGGLATGLEPGPIALTNALVPFGDSAFATMQSRFWRAAEDPVIPDDQRIWRIISAGGRYLGTVAFSRDFRLSWIGEGEIWGIASDSVGLPLIQRLVLEPPMALRD